MPRTLIYICFLISGFSGLVNEVVWSRLFVYTLGSSHLSIAVVVAIFMGGLALGSAIGGRLADRRPSPLRLYGWFVGAAGLLSGAVVPLIWLTEPLLGWVYRLNDGQPGHPLFTAAKVAVCLATILAPATCMGATLPALTRHLARGVEEVGFRLGSLYAINAFGAVAGAAAAGFFLVPQIGLLWSASLAAAVDVAVGAAVLLLAGQGAAAAPAPAPPGGRTGAEEARRAAASPDPVRIPWAVRVALFAFGISGFVNMCLQLGWTRALIVSIGNSTYAFSIIVAIFISGLAAGGWIAGLFADRIRNPLAAFGWLLIAIAFASGATIPWLGLSPARFAWKLGREVIENPGNFDFVDFMVLGAGSAALVILPATVLMGMTLPLAGRARALAAPGVGKAVGASYAANTIGAILGTALTGFVLVPLLGRIYWLLYLAVGLGACAGAAVLLAAPGKRRALRWAGLGAAAAAMLGLGYQTRPAGVLDRPEDGRLLWHPTVFAHGAYMYYYDTVKTESPAEFVRALMSSFETEYYRDGEVASVAVLRQRNNDSVSLNISGKPDASAGSQSLDFTTQLLSGHLPMLAHPAPRRALNVGLGGGMTLGAMTLYPDIEEIELIEISPEVVEAARRYFARANHEALDHPKVRVIIGDGRNHLAHTGATYDIISSEPSNFWIAGLGNLFTEEFYRLILDRLNPGGIACQFIYAYSIRPEDYLIALRTFMTVFPHVLVWTDNRNDTLLLGSREPLALHRDRIAMSLTLPAIREELGGLGVRAPEDLFRYFKDAKPAFLDWIGAGRTNRDLFPVLEFSSPLGFFILHTGIHARLEAAASLKPPPGLLVGFSPEQMALVEARRRQGRLLLLIIDNLYSDRERLPSGKADEAIALYEELVREGDPWSIDAAAHEIAENIAREDPRRRELFTRARSAFDTPELCMADDFILPQGIALRALIDRYHRFTREAGSLRWQPHLSMAELEATAAMFEEALGSAKAARRHGAPGYRVAKLRGAVLGVRGDLTGSESALREALDTAPPWQVVHRREAAYNLGFCLEQQGRIREASEAYRTAIRYGNDPIRTGTALARCLRRDGQAAAALEAARGALKYAEDVNKDSAEARAEVARALALAGNFPEALRWLESAARLAPGSYDQELEDLRRRGGGR